MILAQPLHFNTFYLEYRHSVFKIFTNAKIIRVSTTDTTCVDQDFANWIIEPTKKT